MEEFRIVQTYPVFIMLEGRSALVVGGGEVASRKVASLLDAGAVVRVVAKEVDSEICTLAETETNLTIDKREYVSGEAANYFLIVASTSSQDVNRAVAADAEAAGRLVNVVDQPELCNFIVPSVIRRGALSKAISTGGASPAFSRRIRQRLEVAFPETLSSLVELLGEFRAKLMESVADFNERKRILTEVVNSKEIDLFLDGDERPLKEYLARWN